MLQAEFFNKDLNNITASKHSQPVCGDCYGAKANDSHCCNTCQDVIDAYREKRWNPNTDKFEQCHRENYVNIEMEAKNIALNEGCQIYGYLEVNRVIFDSLHDFLSIFFIFVIFFTSRWEAVFISPQEGAFL